MKKNEPKTNPIQTNRLLSWPAVRHLSIYSSLRLAIKLPSLQPTIQPITNYHLTNKQNMRNEPNFKNTKKSAKSFMAEAYRNFRCFQRQKNEPKTNPIYADSNPICGKNTKIYALSKYNFLQLFTQKIRKSTCTEPVEVQLFTTFRPKNMQNEPNLKNTKINLSPVLTKAYMKNGVFTPSKNEPKTNPISNFPLRFNQFMKNMQNEPNFQNPRINVTPFEAKHYENNQPFTRRQNEPNLWKTNPILVRHSLLWRRRITRYKFQLQTTDAPVEFNHILFCSNAAVIRQRKVFFANFPMGVKIVII